MQRWEYHTETHKYLNMNLERTLQASLARLGSEGWELVSTTYFTRAVHSPSQEFLLVFKRPK